MASFKSIAQQHQVEVVRQTTRLSAEGDMAAAAKASRDLAEGFLRQVAPLFREGFAIDGQVAVELVLSPSGGSALATKALTDDGKAFMAWVRDEFRKAE